MCNVQRVEVAPRPGSRVCRSLFGPVDHVELRREVHARLREMQEESSRRWDFDFQRGVPLPSSRYAWEESGEETVPQFYRTKDAPEKTAPDCPPTTPDCPPTTPDCPPTALIARPAGAKRSPPAAQITDFFPARKKTKVVASLCDKLHSASPIPTEHTPRKMIR